MYVTADGADNVQETVLADDSVSNIGGPSSVSSSDVQKVGVVITNTPDGRMRLTDYLTNVEKEIAAEEAARTRDVAAVRAQMARNFAFNKAARDKLNKALLAKMAANAKAAKEHLAAAMTFVQAKFAAAAALQNKRHKLEDEQAAEEQKQIAHNKKAAKEALDAAVHTQQRAMAALTSATNAHIAQTDKAVAKNAAQIADNAKKAAKDLANAVNKFDTKVANARAEAQAGRSKLAAQLVAQDKESRQFANAKLKEVVAKNMEKFQDVRNKMAAERQRVDLALKQASTRMDAALKAQSALEDKHFADSVKDIAAAKAEAKASVDKAETEFKLGLNGLTETVNRQVQMTNNRIDDLSGVVSKNKLAQAKINANVNAEKSRMVKLGKARYDEHVKKDQELKKLIDSNKAATDARMDQMASHYLMELDAVRSTMKKNRAHASKMLGKASSELYSAIAKSEAAQTKVNGELQDQTREAAAAIRDSLKEAKSDFTKRHLALEKKVTDNQKKFEGKLDKLTGIVRENAAKDAQGRREIAEIQKSNKAMLDAAVSDAIQQGEKRMNGVESSLMKLNAASKAALNSKITAQISQLTKEANSQIEGLRFSSKEARAMMKKELTEAVRSMAKEAKENLDKEVTKATAAFADMNAKEDAAAAESAAGRAKLAESVAAEKAAAKEALDDNVATLTRSLLALKKETQKKIKKTNTDVAAYAKALEKEAEDVEKLMTDQVNTLQGKIADEKKAASNAITAADAASAAGFGKVSDEVTAALAKAAKESSDKFGKVYRDMATQRAELDEALAGSVNNMNDSIAKEAALADDRFSKTVKSIDAARKQASQQVVDARKDFSTQIDSLTSNIKEMETRLTGQVMIVSSDVIENRAVQARVNAANAAEQKRIEDLMNAHQSESIKARGKLRMVLDENKRAAAEETKELDTLFKQKVASIRSTMAADARDAAKDLTAATADMYGKMATVQRDNIAQNEAHQNAITKYAVESQAAIASSKKDFEERLQTLTNTVATNHAKTEKGLEVLTGVIRDEAKASAADRKLIREQNKAMGEDMHKKIVQAIQLGEAKAKAVENQARANLDSTTQSMLVQITNTVEKYADMAFKTIAGNHQKIADNYLSLKAYAVTAKEPLADYTAKGKGKNLSSLGDLLGSIAAMSAVKPQKAEGLSASGELPSIFTSTKVKVDNKVTKINGMVNEFVQTCNDVRMRWPMGLGKYLLLKLEGSMSDKGVLQVDKVDDKEGNFVFLNGHSVGLSNKLNDFESLAVSMGSYEATLAKITAELSGQAKKEVTKRSYASPPEWDGK
jgi:hypothetical protein